jgi:hypothetical protein
VIQPPLIGRVLLERRPAGDAFSLSEAVRQQVHIRTDPAAVEVAGLPLILMTDVLLRSGLVTGYRSVNGRARRLCRPGTNIGGWLRSVQVILRAAVPASYWYRLVHLSRKTWGLVEERSPCRLLAVAGRRNAAELSQSPLSGTQSTWRGTAPTRPKGAKAKDNADNRIRPDRRIL